MDTIPNSENDQKPQAIDWRITIRSHDIDFMNPDGEVAAGCNCACDCSAISPLPPAPRTPRDRVRTWR